MDSDGEFSSIIISGVNEVITIQLDRFATIFLSVEKIAEQIEKAYRNFKQKYNKSLK